MEGLSRDPLIVMGLFLLIGYLTHVAGQRAHVPRVTLLLLLGFLSGPSGFDLVPHAMSAWFPMVAQLALSIVGFLLGERFLGKTLRKTGKIVAFVSVTETLAASVFVFLALLFFGAPLTLALLLAGIAAATAPAATVDVIRESRSAGPVSDTVLGVVAIDDAYAIVLFSVVLALSGLASGDSVAWSTIISSVWEIAGAVLLGGIIGFPMAWLTGRVRTGELTLIETMGFVLLCSGLAAKIHVSYLLASITMGAVVANWAHHHTRPFHAIEGISQPFLIVFFLLAGFEFELGVLQSLGLFGLIYVASRTVGKVAGGWFGAKAAGASPEVRKHVGWCLLPQAGVALGLGLLAAERFPEVGEGLLSLLVGTTFVFELIGPVITRISLYLASEPGQATTSSEAQDSG